MKYKYILLALCLSLTTLSASCRPATIVDVPTEPAFSALSPDIMVDINVIARALPSAGAPSAKYDPGKCFKGTELRLELTRNCASTAGEIIEPSADASAARAVHLWDLTPTRASGGGGASGGAASGGAAASPISEWGMQTIVNAGCFSGTRENTSDSAPSALHIAPFSLRYQIMQTSDVEAGTDEGDGAAASGEEIPSPHPGSSPTLIKEGIALIPARHFSEPRTPTDLSDTHGTGRHTVQLARGFMPSVTVYINHEMPSSADESAHEGTGRLSGVTVSVGRRSSSEIALALSLELDRVRATRK